MSFLLRFIRCLVIISASFCGIAVSLKLPLKHMSLHGQLGSWI
jgi:hypothetical protein